MKAKPNSLTSSEDVSAWRNIHEKMPEKYYKH
jgi:hypothetical protein